MQQACDGKTACVGVTGHGGPGREHQNGKADEGQAQLGHQDADIRLTRGGAHDRAGDEQEQAVGHDAHHRGQTGALPVPAEAVVVRGDGAADGLHADDHGDALHQPDRLYRRGLDEVDQRDRLKTGDNAIDAEDDQRRHSDDIQLGEQLLTEDGDGQHDESQDDDDNVPVPMDPVEI